MHKELANARGIGKTFEEEEKKIRADILPMLPKYEKAHIAFAKMVDAEANRNFSLVRDHSYKQRDAYKAVTFDNMVQLKSETAQKYYKNHELIGANLADIKTNLYANYVTQKGEAWCEAKFNQIEDDIIVKIISSAQANGDMQAVQDLLSTYGDRVEQSKLNNIRSGAVTAQKQNETITEVDRIVKKYNYDITKIDDMAKEMDYYETVDEGGTYYLGKEYMSSMQGVKYLYGGNGKDGIDCSAYTQQMMQAMKWDDIPRVADAQCKWAEDKGMFRPNDGSYQPKAGDLVFIVNTDPKNKNAYKNVTHVGFVDENGDLQQAGSSKGVGSVPMSTFEGKILGYATTGTRVKRIPRTAKEKQEARNMLWNACVKQQQLEKKRRTQLYNDADNEMWEMAQAGITDRALFQKVANRHMDDKELYRDLMGLVDNYTGQNGGVGGTSGGSKSGSLSSNEEAILKDMIDCGTIANESDLNEFFTQTGVSPAERRKILDYYQNNEFKSFDWNAMKQRFANVIGIRDDRLWRGAKEAAKDYIRQYKANNDGRLPAEEDVLKAACDAGMKPNISSWWGIGEQYSVWERLGIRQAEMYNMKISKIDESSNGYIVTYRDGSQEALTEDELDAKINKERFGMKEK